MSPVDSTLEELAAQLRRAGDADLEKVARRARAMVVQRIESAEDPEAVTDDPCFLIESTYAKLIDAEQCRRRDLFATLEAEIAGGSL